MTRRRRGKHVSGWRNGQVNVFVLPRSVTAAEQSVEARGERRMSDIDLSRLAKPFPASDIEWRVASTGMGRDEKRFCLVFAYITARAIQQRLDDVCGPENWELAEPRVMEVSGKSAFACGISIRLNDEWVTKWDVSGATTVEPAKGGYSGAMKRAGAQWGIGRYLYYLDEAFAEVSEDKQKGWNRAKIPPDKGGGWYWWQPPRLPEWALPKENEVSKEMLDGLVLAWRAKFAAEVESSAERQEGFTRFVHSVVSTFPVTDRSCWTLEAVKRCQDRIDTTTDPDGPDSDIPFDGGDS